MENEKDLEYSIHDMVWGEGCKKMLDFNPIGIELASIDELNSLNVYRSIWKATVNLMKNSVIVNLYKLFETK